MEDCVQQVIERLQDEVRERESNTNMSVREQERRENEVLVGECSDEGRKLAGLGIKEKPITEKPKTGWERVEQEVWRLKDK